MHPIQWKPSFYLKTYLSKRILMRMVPSLELVPGGENSNDNTRHICCCGTGKEKEAAKCWIGDKDRLCCPKQSTGISSGKEKSRIEENLEPVKKWEDKGVRENCNVNVSTISWEGPYFSFLWCRYIFIWFKALSEVLHIHSLSVLLGFVSA